MNTPRLLRPLSACLLILAACAAPAPQLAPEASVKPGINASYLDPDLDVDEWIARFEGESREIFTHRAALAAAVGIEPGDEVADVGAGTGLFLEPFARAVGPRGTVYAVDIVPAFIEHMTQRIAEVGLERVVPHLCSEDSIDLPARSLDKVFICDVYHHFEYPRHTMTSIHRALRRGGEVVLVDFERIPGVSREWVLGHVRAGKDEVLAELDAFGFDLVEELEVPGLTENYVLRLRKR